jgi:hypothetical protein
MMAAIMGKSTSTWLAEALYQYATGMDAPGAATDRVLELTIC